MNTLRLGIDRGGAIARAEHLPRFRAIDGVELAAVAESVGGVDAPRGRGGRDPRAFDRWQDLVADDGIDAVLVATWPDVHAPVTIAALEAGKHVLTEARMASTLEDAQAMAAAAAAHPDHVAMVVPASFSLWADRTLARRSGSGRRHAPARSRPVGCRRVGGAARSIGAGSGRIAA